MLTLYSKLPDRTRFRFADRELPHFIRVNAGHCTVVPAHSRHSGAPACGFLDLAADHEVVTFSDRPLQWRVLNSHVTGREAMLELARTFPALAGFYPDGAAFDPDQLCLTALKFSSGEIAVARFLLTLWNPGIKWKCGRFDLINDQMCQGDRAALSAWLLNPWWP